MCVKSRRRRSRRKCRISSDGGKHPIRRRCVPLHVCIQEGRGLTHIHKPVVIHVSELRKVAPYEQHFLYAKRFEFLMKRLELIRTYEIREKSCNFRSAVFIDDDLRNVPAAFAVIGTFVWPAGHQVVTHCHSFCKRGARHGSRKQKHRIAKLLPARKSAKSASAFKLRLATCGHRVMSYAGQMHA